LPHAIVSTDLYLQLFKKGVETQSESEKFAIAHDDEVNFLVTSLEESIASSKAHGQLTCLAPVDDTDANYRSIIFARGH